MSEGRASAPSRMATQKNPRSGGTSRNVRATGGDNRPRGASVRGPAKNNTPVIIGAVVGGALLLIVIIAVAAGSGGGSGPKKGAPEKEKPSASAQEQEGSSSCSRGKSSLEPLLASFSGTRFDGRAEKHKAACAALADLKKGLAAYAAAKKITGEKYNVSDYEAAFENGTRKLEEDARKLTDGGKSRVDAEAAKLSGPEKDRAMAAVEDALKDMREGVDSWTRLADATGKDVSIGAKQKAFDAAVDRYARDLENEANAAIKEGMEIFKGCEEMLTKGFSDAQKPMLRDKLDKVCHLISHGNNLRDRIFQVSGRQYDDSVAAGKAYKAAKLKLSELK